MGSRPNSYLGYGIAWDEDSHSDSDVDINDIIDSLDANEEVSATIWAHEETACLFIYIGLTFHSVDWDDIGEVDMSKLEIKPEYDDYLKEVCDKFKLNYKEPKIHLLSYYG